MATMTQVDKSNLLLKQIWKKLSTVSSDHEAILADIENNTQTTVSNTTQTASDTTAIALDLNDLKTTVETLEARDNLDKWTLTPGQIKTFTYYAGNVGPDHPASTTTEVEFERFINGGSTVLTIRYTYDINNNVTSITPS